MNIQLIKSFVIPGSFLCATGQRRFFGGIHKEYLVSDQPTSTLSQGVKIKIWEWLYSGGHGMNYSFSKKKNPKISGGLREDLHDKKLIEFIKNNFCPYYTKVNGAISEVSRFQFYIQPL